MSGLWDSVFGTGDAPQKLMADPQAFISGANLESSRDRFISEMDKQQKGQAYGLDPNAAQGAQAATATQQTGLGDFLMQRARGQVPSVADAMLKQRQGQNVNQMAALAQNAGAQGGGSVRNLMRAQGESQAAIQNEASVQKLQEQMAAASLANSVFGTQRSQDLQAGDMLQRANTFNAMQNTNKDASNLQNILALRNIDEADRQAMIRKALADSGAEQTYNQGQVASQGQALGAVMSLASMAMASDENLKKDVKSGTEGAADFLRTLWKDKNKSTGEKVSTTAQEGFGNAFGSIAESYGGQNNYAQAPGFNDMATSARSAANSAGMRMIDNVIGGMDGSRAPGQGGMSGAGMDMLPGSGGIASERQFDASGPLSKMFGGQGISQSKGVAGGASPSMGSVLGSVFSDENLKTQERPGEGAASQFLRAIEPKTYQYKDSKWGQGQQLGVMAQDLERAGPVGQQMVIDTPQGKMVDYGKGFGALMATNAALQQQVDDLNKKIEGNAPQKLEKPAGRGFMGAGSIQKGSELDEFMKDNIGAEVERQVSMMKKKKETERG